VTTDNNAMYSNKKKKTSVSEKKTMQLGMIGLGRMRANMQAMLKPPLKRLE
jgi:hypothetical protein